MRGVLGGACWLVAAIAIVAPGCDREDLVVARIGDGGSGTSSDAGGDAGAPCTDDDDCVGASALYCAKVGCGDDVVGTCKVATPCDDTGSFAPECGCDGVTYWNDCERTTAGVGLRDGAYPCGGEENTQLCETKDDCRGRGFFGTFCALNVAPTRTCDQIKGTCWTVPPFCTGAPTDDYFHQCGAAQGVCEPLCQAILNEHPGTYDENECQN